jgi:hypothetical protein
MEVSCNMEVIEVTKIAANTDTGTRSTHEPPAEKTPELNADALEAASPDVSELHHVREDVLTTNLHRLDVNKALSSLSVLAAHTTDAIALVKSLSGVVEQVAEEPATTQRKDKLVSEAQDLAQKLATALEPSNLNNLEENSPPVETVKDFAKALDFILPEVSPHALEKVLGVTFSAKEAIVETRKAVAEVQSQIESLQESIHSQKEKIQNAFGRLDVEIQNREAAKTTIRSLDRALEVSNQAKTHIKENPAAAVKSYGGQSSAALQLLVG